MRKIIFTLGLASILAGCANNLPVSELRHDVQTVALVQNGVEPISYSTGVIDTSSFWATYGTQVGAQTGGLMWGVIAESEGNRQLSKAEQNALLVKTLYADHDLAPTVYRELMPELAKAWGQPFDTQEVVVLDDTVASVEEGILKNFKSTADLVLMLEVKNINLTERFSMGGAFAAGLTMGMNTKALTTEATVLMRAFKPAANDPNTYEMVWWRMCGPNYTTMKTAYTMEELQEEPARMGKILDEAKAQAVDGCSQVLASIE